MYALDGMSDDAYNRYKVNVPFLILLVSTLSLHWPGGSECASFGWHGEKQTTGSRGIRVW